MQNDDYIPRSDALKAVCENCSMHGDEGEPCSSRCEDYALVLKIPAADVEPVRHGHNVKWDYPTLFECSLCGWECFDTVPGDTDTYQYCPHCGAKMDAEPPKEEDNART